MTNPGGYLVPEVLIVDRSSWLRRIFVRLGWALPKLQRVYPAEIVRAEVKRLQREKRVAQG